MARYKVTEKGQGLFLSVSLSDQLVPGTFEHTLAQLFDEKINLRVFDKRYANDQTGATAIEPRILLKIMLYGYSYGVISSRKIAAMCRSHLVTKALAENTEPHYTTISNFVSGMGVEIEQVFSEVVLVCQELKLIRGNMFAIDGCRQTLPKNGAGPAVNWEKNMIDTKDDSGVAGATPAAQALTRGDEETETAGQSGPAHTNVSGSA